VIPRPLANAIIALVSVVWAANFVAQFLVPGYTSDLAINGIFMSIVGGALLMGRKKDAAGQGPADDDADAGDSPTQTTDGVIRMPRHYRRDDGEVTWRLIEIPRLRCSPA